MASVRFLQVVVALSLIFVESAHSQAAVGSKSLRRRSNQTGNQFLYFDASDSFRNSHHQPLAFELSKIHYNQPVNMQPSESTALSNDASSSLLQFTRAAPAATSQKSYRPLLMAQNPTHGALPRSSIIMPPNNDIETISSNGARAAPPAPPTTTAATTTEASNASSETATTSFVETQSVSQPSSDSSEQSNFEQLHSPSTRVEPMQGTVFYEGPATVPPLEDYFFTSSEPQQSSKPSNIWW